MSFFVIQKMSSLLIILPLHKIVMKIIPTSKIWTILNLRIKNPHKTHGLHCSPKRFFFHIMKFSQFQRQVFSYFYEDHICFYWHGNVKVVLHTILILCQLYPYFSAVFLAIKIHLHMYICGVFVPLIKD